MTAPPCHVVKDEIIVDDDDIDKASEENENNNNSAVGKLRKIKRNEKHAVSYVFSEKGNRCLVVDGHVFYKDRKTSDGTNYWRCSKYAMQCRKRIHTNGDKVIHIIGEHNHELIVKVNNVPSRPPRRMTKHWQNIEIDELINSYERNRFLWDHSSLDYKDKRKRADVIDEIATQFNTTKDQIYIKIHNLRNRFSNEMKKIKSKKSIDDSFVSKWEYFDRLMFLEANIEYTAPPLLNLLINDTLSETTNIKQEKLDGNGEIPDECSDNDTNEFYSYQDIVPSNNVKSSDLPPYFFSDNTEFNQIPDDHNSEQHTNELHTYQKNIKRRRLEISDSDSREYHETTLATPSPPLLSPQQAISLQQSQSQLHQQLQPLQQSSLINNSKTQLQHLSQIHPQGQIHPQSHMKTSEQENEADLFGKYIASQLKQMAADVSLQLQLEIQGLIGRKRLELMTRRSNHSVAESTTIDSPRPSDC